MKKQRKKGKVLPVMISLMLLAVLSLFSKSGLAAGLHRRFGLERGAYGVCKRSEGREAVGAEG